MTEPTTVPKVSTARRGAISRWLVPILLGMLLGAGLAGAAMFALMPGMMITVHQSKYGLDETVEKLHAAIKAQGWEVPTPSARDLTKSLAKQGVQLGRQVRIVELCHPEYAKSVLTTNRELGALMPCAFAVYEGDDGRIYISGMNTGLMGRMFGGNVAKVMGGKVSADEKEILSAVIKE